MSDLYTIDEAAHTITTRTCRMVDHTLHNTEGLTYEEVTLDLCRCMCAAIEADDAQGKLALGYALHTLLSNVLGVDDDSSNT